MKKTLITILVTVLLCVGVVGTTFAWLMDKTETIENTFTFGNVDIDLKETGATNNKQSFKMMPGDTIKKDPTVTVVDGSEDCYLFVKVVASANFGTYMTYGIADGWTALPGVANVYYREVKSDDTTKSFAVLTDNQVKVLDTITQTDVQTLNTAISADASATPSLTVTAYAVQKDNVANAATAWGYIPNP